MASESIQLMGSFGGIAFLRHIDPAKSSGFSPDARPLRRGPHFTTVAIGNAVRAPYEP
jgi:hypothetical protein